MSIEKNIERIADALEKIASIYAGPALKIGDMAVVTTDVKPVAKLKAPTPKVAPVVDVIPGIEEEVALEPVVEGGIKTGAELRELAQRYIQVAGDNTGELVKFIQSIARIFSPKEPKIIKIPNEKVAEAAKMMTDWCSKKGLTLPIEV